LQQFGVPEELLNGIITHVSISTEYLNGVGSRLHGGIGTEGFGNCGLDGVRLSLIEGPRRPPIQQASGFYANFHFSEHGLN